MRSGSGAQIHPIAWHVRWVEVREHAVAGCGSSLPAAGAFVVSVPVLLLAFDGAVGGVPAAVVHGLLLAVIALTVRGSHSVRKTVNLHLHKCPFILLVFIFHKQLHCIDLLLNTNKCS